MEPPIKSQVHYIWNQELDEYDIRFDVDDSTLFAGLPSEELAIFLVASVNSMLREVYPELFLQGKPPKDWKQCRQITFDGVTAHLAEWSRRTGINERTISNRLAAGWSVHDTLLTPTPKMRKDGKKPKRR